jgi:hypothetical protein
VLDGPDVDLGTPLGANTTYAPGVSLFFEMVAQPTFGHPLEFASKLPAIVADLGALGLDTIDWLVDARPAARSVEMHLVAEQLLRLAFGEMGFNVPPTFVLASGHSVCFERLHAITNMP